MNIYIFEGNTNTRVLRSLQYFEERLMTITPSSSPTATTPRKDMWCPFGSAGDLREEKWKTLTLPLIIDNRP